MSSNLVEIIFTRAESTPAGAHPEEISLFFKALDCSPAQKWLRYLDMEVAARSPVEEYFFRQRRRPGRFIGFPGGEKSLAELARLINRCIDEVNSYRKGAITVAAHEKADHRLLNDLHKFFEILRGPMKEPAEFFRTAPANVQDALEDFNRLIHEYEACNRYGSQGAGATISITFSGERERHDMTAEDYSYFSLYRDFGGLYLHYCEVGKTLLDVFEDQDEVIGIQNIRPLEVISADFDVYFGEPTKYRYGIELRTRLHAWLKARGLDPLDPRLCLGYIKVGQMVTDNRFAAMSRTDFLDYFGRYLCINRIVVH
jgi:hypothetical protein